MQPMLPSSEALSELLLPFSLEHLGLLAAAVHRHESHIAHVAATALLDVVALPQEVDVRVVEEV